MPIIYFIGNAGCGKSALTSAFKNWMQLNGFDAVTINLDPGAEWLPYAPDIDVREWINTSEIMHDYGVGPNGAQIIAADLLALKIKNVIEAMKEYVTDYFIVDTPGQMELFTLREASNIVIKALGEENSMLFYLFDPHLAKTPQGYVALLMQSLSAQFRLELPTVHVLTKVDLITLDEKERILEWGEDANELYEALIERSSLYTNLSIEFFRALEMIDAFKPLIPTSAETGEGMADIYAKAQDVFFGGEDLSED